MKFRINNENGQFDIIFTEEEIKILNEKKMLSVGKEMGKKFIDGLGLCVANLANEMCKHNNQLTNTDDPIDLTDGKSNK